MAAVPAIHEPTDGIPGAAADGWLTWSDSEEGEETGTGACRPARTGSDFNETVYHAAPVVPRTPKEAVPSREMRDAWDEPGVLSDSAASIVMKVMYGARMARVDFLRAVQGLARHMTKWTRRQDQ